MDLSLSQEHERFRTEVREWIAAEVETPWSQILRVPGNGERELIEIRRAWQRKLYEAGYLGLSWPSQWGGHDKSGVEEVILAEELSRAEAAIGESDGQSSRK